MHLNVKITNVVVTADIKQSVDVRRFINYAWGIYDNEIYGGRCGYIKDRSMQGRVTVFPSGKIISVGAKSIEEAIDALKRAVEIMVNSSIIARIDYDIDTKVENIVGLVDLGRSIDVKGLASNLRGSIYEPDHFPGLQV